MVRQVSAVEPTARAAGPSPGTRPERRRPLQETVGAGVTEATFEAEVATEAGHVGSTESVAMLADAPAVDLDAIEESIEPVVADDRVETEHVTAEAGDVAGIKQVAHGYVDGEAVVTLDLQMYVGADDPHDRVTFEGEPAVAVEVEGGYHGDVSTSAVVANVARPSSTRTRGSRR